MPVSGFAKKIAEEAAKPQAGGGAGEGIAAGRGEVLQRNLKEELDKMSSEQKKDAYAQMLDRARQSQDDLKAADANYKGGKLRDNQTGRLGVDLAQTSQDLRGQERLTQSANRKMNGRNCVEIGGVWVDDKYTAKTKTITVKAMSNAYFKILEKQPTMKDVFRTGNHLVWITPCGTALVIDTNDGVDELKDAEIDALFVSAK